MHYRRLPSLFVALFLQFTPLVRTFQPVVTGILQPLVVLLRLASAATAVAGGAHALSGATGLQSAAALRGTNGATLSYRVQISSTEYGAAKSYKIVSGAPAGLAFTSITLGTASGTITAPSGVYSTVFRGFEHNNQSGHFYDATVLITIVAAAPTISQDPLTQTVVEGSNVTLTVVASAGGETPTYQWIKDGTEVPSETNPSIVFAPVKLSDHGSYKCRVQNSGGIALSGAGILTVNPASKPPVINSFAALPAASLHAGETLTLGVSATAASALTYQWFLGPNPVAGATGATLVVPKIATGNAGSYTVKATANALSATSSPLVVSVGAPLAAGTVTAGTASTSVAFGAIAGRHYFLESAAAPDSPSWKSVADGVAAQPAGSLVDPSPSDAEVRLYRLRVQ